jgi:hypothetical protein
MRMDAREFLELFSGILSGTKEAKEDVQEIIDNIVQSLNDYEMEIAGLKSDSDYDDNDDEDGEYANPAEEPEAPTNEEPNTDYANMSQKELLALVNQYLDAGDYTNPELGKISKYINESKQDHVANKINECRMNNAYVR